jgi:hypothetical protein
MGKFDYIAELTGSDNYPSWRRAVELALAGERFWNHCSNGTDPADVGEYASSMPTLATAGQPTAAELLLMKAWVKEDAQAKVIIGRRLSPIVQNMLGEKLTARQQWETALRSSGCHFPIRTAHSTLLRKIEGCRGCVSLSGCIREWTASLC